MAALEQWPESGVPDNPGAWLMAVARRRAIDQIRRERRYARKLAEIGREVPAVDEGDESVVDAALAGDIDDELLERLGRLAEARSEFEQAAALTRNDRERGLLLDRAAACG